MNMQKQWTMQKVAPKPKPEPTGKPVHVMQVKALPPKPKRKGTYKPNLSIKQGGAW